MRPFLVILRDGREFKVDAMCARHAERTVMVAIAGRGEIAETREVH